VIDGHIYKQLARNGHKMGGLKWGTGGPSEKTLRYIVNGSNYWNVCPSKITEVKANINRGIFFSRALHLDRIENTVTNFHHSAEEVE